MAELFTSAADEADLDTLLAEDTEFEGTLEFNAPLLVKGQVAGELRGSSRLLVAETAVLKANITAKDVVVYGVVKGVIDAEESITLFSLCSTQRKYQNSRFNYTEWWSFLQDDAI